MSKTVENSRVIMHDLVLPNDTNVLGNVHGGRVMCLMDICAAMSAYKHARTPVVTASVDKLDFLSPAKKGEILIEKISADEELFLETIVDLEIEDIDLDNSDYYTILTSPENFEMFPATIF